MTNNTVASKLTEGFQNLAAGAGGLGKLLNVRGVNSEKIRNKELFIHSIQK